MDGCSAPSFPPPSFPIPSSTRQTTLSHARLERELGTGQDQEGTREEKEARKVEGVGGEGQGEGDLGGR